MVPAEFTGYFTAAAAVAGVLIGLLVLGVGTYPYQLIVGVLLVSSPKDRSQVFSIAYLAIASFAVALSRAWSLVR